MNTIHRVLTELSRACGQRTMISNKLDLVRVREGLVRLGLCRGTSILGEVRNVEIPGATQQLRNGK